MLVWKGNKLVGRLQWLSTVSHLLWALSRLFSHLEIFMTVYPMPQSLEGNRNIVLRAAILYHSRSHHLYHSVVSEWRPLELSSGRLWGLMKWPWHCPWESLQPSGRQIYIQTLTSAMPCMREYILVIGTQKREHLTFLRKVRVSGKVSGRRPCLNWVLKKR